MVRMRLKIPDELEVLVVIDAPESHGVLSRNQGQAKTRIGRAVFVIDAREHPSDFIWGY